MALGVLQAACRQQIHVPEQLAVAGFDGLPEAAHYWPPLTTVYQDQHRLGCIAVRELVRAIEAARVERAHAPAADSEPELTILYPDLIARASSGAAQVGTGCLQPAAIPILSTEMS